MSKLLGLAVTALAVAACSANPDAAEPAAAGGQNSCAAMELTTGDAFPPSERQRLLARERTIPNQIDGERVNSLAINESGEMLVEIGRRDDPQAAGSAGLHPGTLAVLDPNTGARQQIRGPADIQDGTQTVFAALDDDHVVWAQERGTTLAESAWEIYAASRASGRISLVARAKPVDAQGTMPTVPGYTIPQLRRGRVYWAEARGNPTPGQPPVVDIYSRRLDSTEPAQLVARNAILPVPTEDWLYYAGFDGTDADKPGYTIYRRSLRTGQVDVVAAAEAGPGVEFLAAHDRTVGWSLRSGTVEVQRDGRLVARVRAGGDEQLGWLSAGVDTVGFSDGSGVRGGVYLLDLRDGCLHSLVPPEQLGSSVMIAGRTVLWNTLTGDAATGRQSSWHLASLA